MRHLAIILISGLLITAGCSVYPSDRESHYDRVSREIEQLKAASEIGDNIKIVVNFLSITAEERFSIDALWRYADENIVVANRPAVYKRSGLRIGLAGETFSARLNILKEQDRSSKETELFLVLADRSSGYIFIGRQIAVPRFYYRSRWYTSVGYDFQQAGRSLEVAVRKLPSGMIDIELTPVFSEFLNDGGDLRLTELSTRVSVLPGQTLVIGGGDSTGENIASALFGYSKSGRHSQTLMTVTPYVN